MTSSSIIFSDEYLDYPDPIRKRRQDIVIHRDRLRNLVVGADAVVAAADEDIDAATTRIEILRAQERDGAKIDKRLFDETDAARLHARKAHESATTDRSRLGARAVAATDILTTVDRLLAALRRGPEPKGDAGPLGGGRARAKVEPAVQIYRPKIVKPAGGIWYPGAVETSAKRIETIRLRAATDARPTDSGEAAKAKVRAIVTDLALRGEPSVFGALPDARPTDPRLIVAPQTTVGINWPSTPVSAKLRGDDYSIPHVTDAAALICWLAKDRIIEALERDIEEAFAEANPIDPVEKARLLKELDAKALEYERIEAEFIWRALDAGENCFFRGDTDPRAILGIL